VEIVMIFRRTSSLLNATDHSNVLDLGNIFVHINYSVILSNIDN